MVEAIALNATELVDAFRIWSGWGRSSRPCRDEQRMEAQYEASECEHLLSIIGRLEEDFYASDASRIEADLERMVARAEADFRRLHPDVAEEIVHILGWCYGYDYR